MSGPTIPRLRRLPNDGPLSGRGLQLVGKIAETGSVKEAANACGLSLKTCKRYLRHKSVEKFLNEQLEFVRLKTAFSVNELWVLAIQIARGEVTKTTKARLKAIEILGKMFGVIGSEKGQYVPNMEFTSAPSPQVPAQPQPPPQPTANPEYIRRQ